jgi:cytochrome c biogenesis protein CcmG/thiol:disulfide interchange protein DsbE
MSDTSRMAKAGNGKRVLFALLPLAVFLALAFLFLTRLGTDSSKVPSALIGRAVPAFSLPPLQGVPQAGFSHEDLKKGGVTVVNVFASWCGPCRDEHPQLMALAKNDALKARGVRIAGLNYKDEPGNAKRFLDGLGNPYELIGADRSGRVGIDWGVYGVPETFVVRGDGTIAYKFIGPISEAALEKVLVPEIEKAMKPR